MKLTSKIALTLLCTTCLATADVVRTIDGAQLTGTITLIDKGVIHLETPYAGTLKIQQEQVASFESEQARVVRLESGTIMAGPIASDAQGNIRIQSEDGVLETSPTKVAAAWNPDAEDPEVVRNRRSWGVDAYVDVNGETGNTEEFEVLLGIEGRLEGPDDALALYIEYEQSEEDGNKTDDRIEGGVSYDNFYGEVFGWYARTEMEQDRIDEIDFRSLSSGGLSYRVLQKPHQTLLLRSGVGYEYIAYSNDTENQSSATLELAADHKYTYKDHFTVKTYLKYIPLVSDFGDYTFEHDTGVEIPIGNSESWKIRFGINNEYESQPALEEKLETTYYTRMIYSWE